MAYIKWRVYSSGLNVLLNHRVKSKDGVAFLGARASNPVLWTVSQDVRSEGHRVITLHCHRKENTFGQRSVAPSSC
ncbi:hypothetical protein J4Q44_G00135760 [Coregonus suidteri]|uniref:Transmembrane protein TMEM132 cohesin-like domain-containing protein n=1 Tax=Coregonus suidteri TaxID=861788 RepID=A0AAN8LV34_9TELE